MTRVLVTGGLGFIGSHVVSRLIKKGFDVTVLDNLEKQVHPGHKSLPPNIQGEILLGDVRHKVAWTKALQHSDFVIHLAGVTGSVQSFWQAKKYMDVNATGTAYLQQLLIQRHPSTKQVKKLVIASSSYIYGEGAYVCGTHGRQRPGTRGSKQLAQGIWEVLCPKCSERMQPIAVNENDAPDPPNPYAVSKYAAERVALTSCNAIGLPATALRYFNVYGPGQSMTNPYVGVLSVFLNRMGQGRPPILFEDGKMARDFVYVDDVSAITVSALEKGEGVFNVGAGKATSIKDVCTVIRRELDSPIDFEVSGQYRPGDTRCIFADVSLLRSVFGSYEPACLEKGVRSLVSWGMHNFGEDNFKSAERERHKYLGVRTGHGSNSEKGLKIG